jgi:hypothetical protein
MSRIIRRRKVRCMLRKDDGARKCTMIDEPTNHLTGVYRCYFNNPPLEEFEDQLYLHYKMIRICSTVGIELSN